jgi:alpha-N-arabinofuranosidase
MSRFIDRRRFLARLSSAGALLAGSSWLPGFGFAQSRGPARAVIDQRHYRADLDRRVLGAFLEHLGRAVYGGVYDPGNALSDERGFRRDVIDEIRQMGVPIIRYPGGNFVSGYHWQDGVGPKNVRPTVLERAWNSLEPNQFGTNEFIDWCRAVGTEPLLGFNMGTAPSEEAVAYVEYCNYPRGTKWSDLRRSHGYEQPHNVRYWCLGNEMDGPWQMGTMPAREYGRKARDIAQQIRVIDRSVRLIACGSSAPSMDTYLVWDREVLEECFDMVDGISLHCYYGNTAELSGNDTTRYLAMNLDMERQILEIGAVCDYVQALYKSQKRLWLSFDEWNVWYRARSGEHTNGRGEFAPHLLEEQYNLEDALLVGGFLNTLLRQSERTRIACLAQIVNVIAPLMTSPSGLLRQTTFYPYLWSLKYARGRVLDPGLSGETYEIRAGNLREDYARNDLVPYVDVAITFDRERNEAAVFLLNRDLEQEREIVLDWQDPTPTRVLAAETLTGPDLKASNTFDAPNRVRPQEYAAPRPGPSMTLRLPKASYTVVHLATA